MANVTLSLDDETFRQARSEAERRGVSLSELVRRQLGALRVVDVDWFDAFVAEADRVAAASTPPETTAWTREELHDERLDRHGRRR